MTVLDKLSVSQWRWCLLATVAGVAILPATPAFAQEAQPSAPTTSAATVPSAAVPEEERMGLGDIVVTAQRRSESAQRVPVAINALDTKALNNIGFTKPADVVAIVPSVQVQEVYGKFQPIFAIRGIAQQSYSANQSSPVGVYADEVYIGETFLHGANFFDLERVEVLKGPQGTLYGKNTTGGAINMISRTPSVDDGAHMNFTVGYGNYDAVRSEAGVEGALIPGKLAVRVSGYYTDDDGFQRVVNLGTRGAETHLWGARATVVFEPTSNFSAILRYTHGETDQVPNYAFSIGYLPGGVDFAGYKRPNSLGFWDVESDVRDQRLKIRYDLVSLTGKLSLDTFDIVSVTGYHTSDKYQKYDVDGSPFNQGSQLFNNKTKAFSQDMRVVTTGTGPLKLIVGGYYGFERNDQHNTYDLYATELNGLIAAYTPLVGAPTANYIATFLNGVGQADQRQNLYHRTWAGYGEATYKIGPRFGVTVGLRYTRDTDVQDYYNTSTRVSPTFPTSFVPAGTPAGTPLGSYIPGNITAGTANPIDALFYPDYSSYLRGPYTTASAPRLEVTNNRLTGKITLDFKPTDTSLLYATYSRGYRNGNYNAGIHWLAQTTSQGAYATPETVNAYEIGLKSEWFGRSLRFNASGFWYDYSNQQFEDVRGVSNVLLNAGKSRVRGIETELLVSPVQGLTLSLNGLYLDAKYRQLTLQGFNLNGNTLPSSPKWSGTAAIDYLAPLGGNFDLAFHVDASARSRQYYSAFNRVNNNQNIGQSGYSLVNGRVALRNSDGYELAFWTKNLFNKKYVAYAINLQSAYANDYLMAGSPRTYGVELSYKF